RTRWPRSGLRRARGTGPDRARIPAPRAAAPPRQSRGRLPRRRASRAPPALPSGRPAARPSRGRAGSAARARSAPGSSARAGRRRTRSPSAAPREAEHALGDDVPQNLGAAGLDRVAAAAQLLVVPPAVVDDSVGSEQLAAKLRQALVLLRPAQLDRRSFRSWDACALVRPE